MELFSICLASAYVCQNCPRTGESASVPDEGGEIDDHAAAASNNM